MRSGNSKVAKSAKAAIATIGGRLGALALGAAGLTSASLTSLGLTGLISGRAALAGPQPATATGGAQARPDKPDRFAGQAEKHVSVRLAQAARGVAPGQSVAVALVMDIAPGWHTYWHGQNDTGLPTSIEWIVPRGVTVSQITAPVPARHVSPGDLLDYIHEGLVVITARLNVPSDATPGSSITLRAKVAYLVCQEACLPGNAEVSAEVTVLALDSPPTPIADDAALIATAAKAQARPDNWGKALTAGWSFKSGRPEDGLTLLLTSTQSETLAMAFFPDMDGLILREPLSTGQAAGGQLKLTFDAPKSAAGKPGAGQITAAEVPSTVRGVVQMVRQNGEVSNWFLAIPLPPASVLNVAAPASKVEPQPPAKPQPPAEPQPKAKP